MTPRASSKFIGFRFKGKNKAKSNRSGPDRSSSSSKPGADKVTPDDIGSPDTVVPPGAQKSPSPEEVETRTQRLGNNLLEQKSNLISTLFGLLLFVIISLYTIFIATLLCLYVSTAAFKGPLPSTGVIILGMTASVPTILSLTFVIGLFKESGKDKEKDKDDKLTSDAASALKAVADILKYTRH